MYMCMLMYLVLFAEFMGRAEGYTTYRYNFIPFHEIMRFLPYIGQNSTLGAFAFVNIIGNILIFIPYGIAMPVLSNERVKCISTCVLALSLSVSIEIIQLIGKAGTCDVDDCLLNTLGALIGYICYISIKKILNHFQK